MKKTILKLVLLLFTLSGMAQTYKITYPKVEVKTDTLKVMATSSFSNTIKHQRKPERLNFPLYQSFNNDTLMYEFRVNGKRNNPNMFSGFGAGNNVTTGKSNNHIGAFGQINITSGNRNNSFGNNSLALNATADGINAFGYASFYKLKAGGYCTAIGDNAAPNLRYGFGINSFGAGNITLLDSSSLVNVFGINSLTSATATKNTNVFGNYSLANIKNGEGNNIFGNSGWNYTNAESFNTILGNSAGIVGENNNVILADGAGNEIIHINAADRGAKRILITDANGVGKYKYIDAATLAFNTPVTGQVLTVKSDGYPEWKAPPTVDLFNYMTKTAPECFNSIYYVKNDINDYSPLLTHNYFGWNQFDLRANNSNIYLGRESGKLSTTTATRNNAIGANSFLGAVSGTDNNGIGSSSFANLTSGINNFGGGTSAFFNLTTGNANTGIGPAGVGSAYTTENYNTLLGKVTGSVGDSHRVIIADGAGNQIINVTASDRTAGRVLTTDANGVGRFVTPLASDFVSKTLADTIKAAKIFKVAFSPNFATVNNNGFEASNGFFENPSGDLTRIRPSGIEIAYKNGGAFDVSNIDADQIILRQKTFTNKIALRVSTNGGAVIQATQDGFGNIPVEFPSGVQIASLKITGLNAAPANATAPGSTGDIRYTATHIYLCIATNTWVRSALATW
ncbi:MAG: hypothetical protein EAY81_10510 [Bacteroidetes bacterium]|nr:MAG: hypothetical protein EAY81_10510 [Bacteroidota bacterium]